MRAYNEPAWVPDVILSAGTCTDGGELAETGRKFFRFVFGNSSVVLFPDSLTYAVSLDVYM